MEDPALAVFLVLIAAAFLAGFVDSIAGGGGLITVPALLLAGLPPITALGTNKLQSLFGSGSATLSYARGGHVDLTTQLPAAGLSFAGAVAGAYLASVLPAEALRLALPVMLVAIAIYFLIRKDLNDEDRHRRISPLAFTMTLVPAIGFYDGVFGPGTGSFFMLAFVTLAGYGMLKATAHTKLLNFASNVGGFAAFAVLGAVAWKIGIAMGMAQFLGAQFGSRLAMRRGARLIRPLLVATCVALAVRLFADDTYPFQIWRAIFPS